MLSVSFSQSVSAQLQDSFHCRQSFYCYHPMKCLDRINQRCFYPKCLQDCSPSRVVLSQCPSLLCLQIEYFHLPIHSNHQTAENYSFLLPKLQKWWYPILFSTH